MTSSSFSGIVSSDVETYSDRLLETKTHAPPPDGKSGSQAGEGGSGSANAEGGSSHSTSGGSSNGGSAEGSSATYSSESGQSSTTSSTTSASDGSNGSSTSTTSYSDGSSNYDGSSDRSSSSTSSYNSYENTGDGSDYASMNSSVSQASDKHAFASRNARWLGFTAIGLLLALLLAAFLVVLRRKRKKTNRGSERLLDSSVRKLDHSNSSQKNRALPDLEAAAVGTVASSVTDWDSPTSGTYKSLDEAETEVNLSFTAQGEDADEDKFYAISGDGFKKSEMDSHVGFVRVAIVEGYASKDGSKAWWVEERRPFIDTHNQGAMCPKPRTKKCCSVEGVPGIETTFSIDDEAMHRVECTGSFDYENDEFHGEWAYKSPKANGPILQTGPYNLALNAPNLYTEVEEKEVEPKGFQRLKRGLMSMFRKDKGIKQEGSERSKFSKKVLVTVHE